MYHADPVFGLRKKRLYFFIAFQQIFIIHLTAFFNEWINNINLTAFCYFLFYKIHHLWPGRFGTVHGIDGLPPRRQFINHTVIQIAISSKRQCTRYGRCRHHQYMRRNGILFPQLCPLRHTKFVLFINDGKSQVFKNYFLFNNRMCAY